MQQYYGTATKHAKRRTFLVCAGNAPATNPAGKSGGFPARIYSRQSSLARCTTGGKKLLVPVLGKGEQQLINGGLRLTLRALLGQRKRGRKHLQLEGADTLGSSPQADKIVIVRVAAGHGTGGAVRGNAVLFSLTMASIRCSLSSGASGCAARRRPAFSTSSVSSVLGSLVVALARPTRAPKRVSLAC